MTDMSSRRWLVHCRECHPELWRQTCETEGCAAGWPDGPISAPPLSPGEAAVVARFESAPYPADVLREQIAAALMPAMRDAWDAWTESEWEALDHLADALLDGPLARFVQ